MASKESYQLTSHDLPTLVQSLNFIFSRIADRLDQIEGNRGTSTVVSGLTIDNTNIVHGFNTENEV